MEKVNFSPSTLKLIEEYIKNQKIKEMEREGFKGIHIRIGGYDEEKIQEIIIRNNAQQIANCLLPKNEEESELIKIFNETLKCINKALEECLKEPTLEECIKEWEEKGFELKENTEHNLLFRHYKEDNVVEIFKKDLSYMFYQWFDDGTQLSIPYDLHNLIHKTLKALEETKNV